jgi:hypothetical protein
MKAKDIAALESYFKTENEYWNNYTFKMLCEVLQQGKFENPELPLRLFNDVTDMFVEKHETPLQAAQVFAGELDKHKLSSSQKLFLYEWVCDYLKETVYKDLDLTPIKDLLESQKDKLKVEIQPEKPLTKNMRESLKVMFKKELEVLPETLSKLEPEKRLNMLIKLMPYIMPKVEAVSPTQGEPFQLDF